MKNVFFLLMTIVVIICISSCGEGNTNENRSRAIDTYLKCSNDIFDYLPENIKEHDDITLFLVHILK